MLFKSKAGQNKLHKCNNGTWNCLELYLFFLFIIIYIICRCPIAPHFLNLLPLQRGEPLCPLWNPGGWKGEQQWLVGHQDAVERRQRQELRLLFPVLHNSPRRRTKTGAKTRMTVEVWFRFSPLKCSCLYSGNDFICFVLLYRFRCNSEQWVGGVSSVLSGHPPTADWHQRTPDSCWLTESVNIAEFANRQCKLLQLFIKLTVVQSLNLQSSRWLVMICVSLTRTLTWIWSIAMY